VANHAKFATARLLEGTSANEIFVSMVSRHVVTGRAALAAGTALAMRAMGVPAFQVGPRPHLDAAAPLKSGKWNSRARVTASTRPTTPGSSA
jgi:hypothetical protein